MIIVRICKRMLIYWQLSLYLKLTLSSTTIIHMLLLMLSERDTGEFVCFATRKYHFFMSRFVGISDALFHFIQGTILLLLLYF